MSPRSRGAKCTADAVHTLSQLPRRLLQLHRPLLQQPWLRRPLHDLPLIQRSLFQRAGSSSSGSHVCRSCQRALSRREYASAAAATSPVDPSQTAAPSDPAPAVSPSAELRYLIKAGIVVSRPPLITPDPHPFETAFYLYQRRLNERLVLPFSQYFYYKRGTPAFEHWRRNRVARGGAAARDVGKYNAYTADAWNDEVLVGDDTGSQAKIVAQLVAEEGRADEFKGQGDAKLAGLRRTTEADATNDQRSLERSLSRTLYLVVKAKCPAGQSEPNDGSQWTFPSGTLVGHEGLKEAAQRILTHSLGPNMNTFFVGNHPVGHYVRKFASPRTSSVPPFPLATQTPKGAPCDTGAAAPYQVTLDGEKTFYMKARILAGQADLKVADGHGIDDFKWLSKDEVERVVMPEYWLKIKNMLVAQ